MEGEFMMAKHQISRSKTLVSRSFLFVLLIVICTSFVFISSVFAQEEIKARLFQKSTDLLNQAKAEQADLLSPTLYAKAIERYESATKDFDRGKNVQKKITEINQLLESAIENAKLAKVTYPHLLTAREDALEANAVEYAKDLYERAETLFLETAKTLEKGDINKAKEKSLNAERSYREAELVAIKASIVGNVKTHLKQAQDNDVHKYASFTFNHSQALLAEAEKILNSDRSAKTEARNKAEMAGYEVKHATFLANVIQKLRKDDANWEKLILQNEKYLSQIMTHLGFTPEFDQGFEKPVNQAVEALNNLKQEKQQLANEISSQDQSIESLESDIIKLKAELDKTKEQEAGLKQKLALEQQQRDKFKKVESIFSKNEAKVLREGDQIRLRLIGLNFQSGKAIIEPNYFSLLTKLQRVIKLFHDYHITIEGHTDNRGNDKTNQLLSTRRAQAVKSYLMANMGLTDSQIAAVGYGESKPIASNETEFGRTQNRRIDVVLSPGN
jgi:OOP family OmpA-OmpF porin